MVVAIDGPAGAGKSTVARALARRLGFMHLDSGAMYRAVGLLLLEHPGREPGELARGADIRIVPGAVGDGARVLLDGRDVTQAIRSPDASSAASLVAADGAVREALVARQRALIAHGDWVVEGRDIGTVVAPGAAVKVFLTAEPAERARRRAGELGADAASVLADQAARDERDRTREHSPLQAAADAVTVDTSGVGVEDVVEAIEARVRERRRAQAAG